MLLTPAEKQMAREVCVAFGQGVSTFTVLTNLVSNFYRLSEVRRFIYRTTWVPAFGHLSDLKALVICFDFQRQLFVVFILRVSSVYDEIFLFSRRISGQHSLQSALMF